MRRWRPRRTGIEQSRLDGLSFSAAGFTNLTRDHLDYHGSMEAYRAAKLRLFELLLKRGAAARAMADLDPVTLAMLREIADATRAGFPHRRGRAHRGAARGARDFHRGEGSVMLNLPGRFQADNALLAASLAEALGVEDALSFLPNLTGVRGRLERALVLPNGAAAYVDYAHTPDAISRVLSALRPHATGKLVIVLGAGGDRDSGKRPLMGQAAVAGADHVIVTDDNPRGEEPATIRAAILEAAPGAIEIGDRKAAISRRTERAAARRCVGGGRQGTRAGADHRRDDDPVRRCRRAA